MTGRSAFSRFFPFFFLILDGELLPPLLLPKKWIETKIYGRDLLLCCIWNNAIFTLIENSLDVSSAYVASPVPLFSILTCLLHMSCSHLSSCRASFIRFFFFFLFRFVFPKVKQWEEIHPVGINRLSFENPPPPLAAFYVLTTGWMDQDTHNYKNYPDSFNEAKWMEFSKKGTNQKVKIKMEYLDWLIVHHVDRLVRCCRQSAPVIIKKNNNQHFQLNRNLNETQDYKKQKTNKPNCGSLASFPINLTSYLLKTCNANERKANKSKRNNPPRPWEPIILIHWVCVSFLLWVPLIVTWLTSWKNGGKKQNNRWRSWYRTIRHVTSSQKCVLSFSFLLFCLYLGWK